MKKEEKKIAILDFVKGFEKTAEHDKQKYINDNLKVIKYVPYLIKQMKAQHIIDCACWKETELANKSKRKDFSVNSPVKYLLFIRSIVELYTNLKVETEGFFEEYDMLAKNNLIDVILQHVPEKEIAEFQTMVNMVYDDLITNQYEGHAFIRNEVTRIIDLVTALSIPVLEKVDKLDEDSLKNLFKLIGNIK